ncbi:MAG: hypothetical protein MK102_01060 [Fuerstiella sp.]|nr:hypothetical protein [Fuerstiella sp.]
MTPARILQLMLTVPVLASAAMPAQAQDVILADQILPNDTYLHITVKSVEDAKRQFTESPYGQLINDPALTDFRAEMHNAFDGPVGNVLAEVEAQLGMSVEDILNIPTGEVSVSISGAGNHIGLVLHLDIAESHSQVESLLEMAEQALSKVTKLTQSKEDVDGTEITLYEVLDNVPTPLIKEFGWFLRDNHLVFCSSKRVMDGLIANWDGSSTDSLSSNEKYTHVLNRLETEPGSADSVVYLDLIGLLTKLSQTGSFGQAQLYASMAIAQLPLLGLNQLQAVGMITEEGSGDLQLIQRAMVYAEQPPAGIMRAFMLQPVRAAPPSWVRDDTVFYMATSWQVSEAYAAIESLVDGFQGPGSLSKIIQQASENRPGVHLKDDLIDQLTGEVHLVGGAMDSYSGTNEMLFAVGIQDPGAFRDLLARVSDEPNFQLDIREFRGFTLYERSEAGAVVGLTVANGSLLIAIGEQILEQVLRNDDDMLPLAESEDFRRIAQHFPAEVVAVNFTRPADQYRTLYELLQSGNIVDNFPGMDEIFSEIDFTTLPPYESISKYLTPAGGFTVADENGYVSEGFSLRP